MDSSLVPPRQLTATELSSLRKLLRSKLNINDHADEEDATNLLDYAFDMIDGGENVGHIAEEVSICGLATFIWLFG